MTDVTTLRRKPIDYRQAGFLRRLPGAFDEPLPCGGDTRYGWPSLARIGMAEVVDGRYRRTCEGERALAMYDASLSEEELAILAWVREQPLRMRGIWGVQRLVGAGLAGLGSRSNGTPYLTEAGEAVLVARGAVSRQAA